MRNVCQAIKTKILCSFAAVALLTVFALPAAPVMAQATGTETVTTVKSDCNVSYQELSPDNCGLIKYLTVITNALSAAVGVIVVAMIVWGGIQYSAAGSDPQAVAAARNKIRNAILALLIYIFGFAALQWLVPGGLL